MYVKILNGDHKDLVFKAVKQGERFYYNWDDESFSVPEQEVLILEKK